MSQAQSQLPKRQIILDVAKQRDILRRYMELPEFCHRPDPVQQALDDAIACAVAHKRETPAIAIYALSAICSTGRPDIAAGLLYEWLVDQAQAGHIRAMIAQRGGSHGTPE